MNKDETMSSMVLNRQGCDKDLTSREMDTKTERRCCSRNVTFKEVYDLEVECLQHLISRMTDENKTAISVEKIKNAKKRKRDDESKKTASSKKYVYDSIQAIKSSLSYDNARRRGKLRFPEAYARVKILLETKYGMTGL